MFHQNVYTTSTLWNSVLTGKARPLLCLYCADCISPWVQSIPFHMPGSLVSLYVMITMTNTAQWREVGYGGGGSIQLDNYVNNKPQLTDIYWSSMNTIVTHSESSCTVLHSCSRELNNNFSMLVSTDGENIQCGSPNRGCMEATW